MGGLLHQLVPEHAVQGVHHHPLTSTARPPSVPVNLGNVGVPPDHHLPLLLPKQLTQLLNVATVSLAAWGLRWPVDQYQLNPLLPPPLG